MARLIDEPFAPYVRDVLGPLIKGIGNGLRIRAENSISRGDTARDEWLGHHLDDPALQPAAVPLPDLPVGCNTLALAKDELSLNYDGAQRVGRDLVPTQAAALGKGIMLLVALAGTRELFRQRRELELLRASHERPGWELSARLALRGPIGSVRQPKSSTAARTDR